MSSHKIVGQSVTIPLATFMCDEWKALKAYSRLLFITMATKQPDIINCVAWSREEIVDFVALPGTTVGRALRELRAKEFIFIVEPGGKWRPNTSYALNSKYIGKEETIELRLWDHDKARKEKKHWEVVRQQALERDNHQCTECGETNNLHVHHLTYKHKGHELVTDLITLCRSCHAKTRKTK